MPRFFRLSAVALIVLPAAVVVYGLGGTGRPVPIELALPALVAVATAWGGAAPTELRAAARSGLAILVWCLGLFWTAVVLVGPSLLGERDGGGTQILSIFLGSSLLVDLTLLVLTFAAVVALSGLCARGYTGAPRERAARLVPLSLALLPTLAWAFIAWDDSVDRSLATGVVSTVWLVAALRATRNARTAREPAVPAVASPA